MIFRDEPDHAHRQAGEWLARLHADDRTPDDEAAFRQWLDGDPSRGAAFERASAIWDAVGGLRAQPPVTEPDAPRLSRRMVLAGGSALAVVGASTLGWREAYAGVYRTGIGEQRRLTLDDGSRVMLDTDTRIRFRAGSDARTLSLSAGRVDLDIASDPRPFLIELGARRIAAQTGRLDMRRDGDAMALTAIRGNARIDAAGAPVALSTGDRIAMGAGRPDRIDRPEIDDLIAWQSGRLAFRDDTLTDAVAEMNRYTTRPLVIADPRAAQLRVSGVYRVGDPEAFARSLALLLPVRVAADSAAIRISATDRK